MMSPGRLSVVLPHYNHAGLVREALAAMAGQSLPPAEIIVVDDASTDDSVAVIEACMKADPRIVLMRNERNLGVLGAQERGLAAARGEYVYLAASDDRALPGLFERAVGLLERFPGAGAFCADRRLLDEPTGAVSEQRLHLSEGPAYLSPAEVLRLVRRRYYLPISHPTVVWRREALMEAGGMRTDIGDLADWFAFAVVGFRHGLCYVPETLGVFRVAPNTWSQRAHGARHREAVLKTIAVLERPEFADVRPFFERSSALACCPWRVLRTLLSEPRGRRYLTSGLLAHALLDQAKRLGAAVAPESAKRLYRRFLYRPLFGR